MNDLHARGAHEVSADDALRWAVERIAMHERMIASMAGRLNGLSYAVQCLIGTHPKIEAMQLLWQQALPDVVDAEMEGRLHQTEAYRSGLHQVLASVQQTIDATLQGRSQSHE